LGSSRTRLLSLSMLLAVSLPSNSAEFRDGDDLLRQCTATIGAETMFCYGYLDAIGDLLLQKKSIDGFAGCIPRYVDDPRLRHTVVQFLRENPDLRKLAAPGLVAEALSRAFACQ
jgi:hypothetical protein